MQKVSLKSTLLLWPMVALLVTACASQPHQAEKNTAAPEQASEAEPQQPTQTKSQQKEEVNQDTPTNEDVAAVDPADTDLSPELLFRLMLAEISGQRGHINVAVKQYLEAAKISRDPKVIERAARIAVYARDTQSAIEAAELWTEMVPDSIDANQVAAAMNLRLGNISKAYTYFEKVIDLSTKKGNRNTYLLITSLLGKESDKQAALNVMEQLVSTRQDNPDALYAYGQLALLLGELEKAREASMQALSLKPDWADAYILYSNTLYRQGKKAEALRSLEVAVNKVADNITLRDYYARRLVDEKRYKEAREQFKIILESAPGKTDAEYALALLSLQTNQLDEAKDLFTHLVKSGKRIHESSYYLGQIAEEKGNIDSAVQWYKVIEAGQYKIDAQIRIAMIDAKAGRIAQARERLRSIEVDTLEQEQRILLAEGEILRNAKKHQEAFDVYSEGLARMPDNVNVLYARALTAEKIERLDVTFSDLEKIIGLDPQNAQALNALGYTLVDRTDRVKEGYGYILKAYEMNPGDAAILDSLGWANYRLGNHSDALKYLRMAFEKLKDAEIAAHLGEVLWVMGEQESARDIWDEALQATPTHKLLNDVIKRFTQ
jgi:tetratricopeptide (TPR) repeat protein